LLLAFTLLAAGNGLLAQGTDFTYQGQLSAGGSPANGKYDFTFALFSSNSTSSSPVGATLTNLDVGVTNGLFTVTLDFGPVFTGNATWLAIGVRTNGGGSFAALNPLQDLTPTPYAIYTPNGGSVAASNIVGAITAAQLPASVVTNGASGVNMTGSFSGNGAGLTNLNGASLAAGSVGTAQLAAGTLAAPAPVTATNINAVPNTSYAITNAGATAIYLPANPNIGDAVQITGQGAGGWTAAEYDSSLPGFVTLSTGTQGTSASLVYLGNGQWQTVTPSVLNPNVGIGNASPAYALEVNGDIGLEGTHLIYNSANAVIDWGSGDRYFRTDPTRGNIYTYSNALILSSLGDLTVTGTVTASNGVLLASDRNIKENFTALDPQGVLDKVASLPLSEWNFKADGPDKKHIGPTAQDFHAAFGLDGLDDKHIAVVDEAGVAMVAIQGLNQKLEAEAKARAGRIEMLKEKAAQADLLEKENDSLAARLQELETAVKALAERK